MRIRLLLIIIALPSVVYHAILVLHVETAKEFKTATHLR